MDTYTQYAETAVAEYLCIPLPIQIAPEDSLKASNSPQQAATMAGQEKQAVPVAASPRLRTNTTAAPTTQPLLDTLSDMFTVEPRVLYGHFAHYNLDKILTSPTRKRQVEQLHQLADLFDQTGRVLFYYYAYPRLWKRFRPLKVDESIAIFAQEIWRFAEGPAVEQWRIAEVNLKKMLGDGDMEGLTLLRLDILDGEVLRLHGIAEHAVDGRLAKWNPTVPR